MPMTSSTIPKLKCGSIGSNGIPTVTLDGIQTVRHHHLSLHQNQHQNQLLRYQLLRKIQTNVQKNFESAILQIGLSIEQEMQRLVFSIYFFILWGFSVLNVIKLMVLWNISYGNSQTTIELESDVSYHFPSLLSNKT